MKRLLPSAVAAFASATILVAASGSAADRQPRSIEGLRLAPETTVITEPLTVWGTPDYRRALDAESAAGVAAEDNFWIAFTEILPVRLLGEAFSRELVTRPGFENVLTSTPRFVPLGNGLTDEALQKVYKSHEQATNRPWSSAEHPEIAAWLTQNALALEKASAAAKLPKAYAPLISTSRNGALAGVLLAHVQETRGVVRAYQARAMLSLGEGRNEDAWQDVLTCLRIAKHLEQGNFLIERLVGHAVRSVMHEASVQCMADPTLSADDLVKRWTEVAPLIAHASFAKVARSERLSMLDLLLSLRSGVFDLEELRVELLGVPAPADALSGELGGLPLRKIGSALESMLLHSGDVNEVLLHCNDFQDHLELALAESTYLDRDAALTDVMQEFRLDQSPNEAAGSAAVAFLLAGADGLDEVGKTLVLKEFSTAYKKINTTDARVIARAAVLQAALAMELGRRLQHEEIGDAQDLASLTVQLADAFGIPGNPAAVDPFTGGALKVRITTDSIVIYSIGANRRDDGGRGNDDGPDFDDLRGTIPRVTDR